MPGACGRKVGSQSKPAAVVDVEIAVLTDENVLGATVMLCLVPLLAV